MEPFLLGDLQVVFFPYDSRRFVALPRLFRSLVCGREIQRTLMELLNQLDGFEDLGQVKMVMATNRPGK